MLSLNSRRSPNSVEIKPNSNPREGVKIQFNRLQQRGRYLVPAVSVWSIILVGIFHWWKFLGGHSSSSGIVTSLFGLLGKIAELL